MRIKITLLATAVLSAAGALLIQQLFTFSEGKPSAHPIPGGVLRPIGEFEPSFGLAVSEQLLFRAAGRELVKEIIKARSRVYLYTTPTFQEQLDELLNEKKPFSPEELDQITKIQLEHESFWLRDFFPIPILKTYPTLPPTPSFVDFVYRDGNSFDDAAIHQFALAINSSVEHLPLVIDGGNFMTDSSGCVLSNELTADPEAPQLSRGHPEVANHIGAILRQAMGCEKTEIVSQIPHPHVDMWMKFVKKGTLLLNEISEQSLSLIASLEPEEQDRIRKIKLSLDQTAKHLAKSFQVIRLPMPLPVHDIFFTYANSVIVNDTVIIPKFKNPDPTRGPFPDKQLYAAYEEEVARIYRAQGLRPVFIDGDELIKEGGSFHCVTFHLPDLDSIVNDPDHLASRPKK